MCLQGKGNPNPRHFVIYHSEKKISLIKNNIFYIYFSGAIKKKMEI